MLTAPQMYLLYQAIVRTCGVLPKSRIQGSSQISASRFSARQTLVFQMQPLPMWSSPKSIASATKIVHRVYCPHHTNATRLTPHMQVRVPGCLYDGIGNEVAESSRARVVIVTLISMKSCAFKTDLYDRATLYTLSLR